MRSIDCPSFSTASLSSPSREELANDPFVRIVAGSSSQNLCARLDQREKEDTPGFVAVR